MRYSDEEMALPEKNPYIRNTTPLTFVMEDGLYESLFEKWLHDKRLATIREGAIMTVPLSLASSICFPAHQFPCRGIKSNANLQESSVISCKSKCIILSVNLLPC